MRIKPLALTKQQSNSHRAPFGFTLAEMVVAVGVSAIFVLMLASLLAQTLTVSGNMQKQLYSVAIAELLAEHAKKIPFEVLSSYANKGTQSINVYADNNVADVPRLLPAQFDLNSSDTIFGAVNASSGAVTAVSKWTITSGNFFKGTVSETITDVSDKVGLECLEVTISIGYATTGKESKRISRSILVFRSG